MLAGREPADLNRLSGDGVFDVGIRHLDSCPAPLKAVLTRHREDGHDAAFKLDGTDLVIHVVVVAAINAMPDPAGFEQFEKVVLVADDAHLAQVGRIRIWSEQSGSGDTYNGAIAFLTDQFHRIEIRSWGRVN